MIFDGCVPAVKDPAPAIDAPVMDDTTPAT